MKTVYSINWKIAPKSLPAFKKWHKLACKGDTMTASERFVKEGGKIPKSKTE